MSPKDPKSPKDELRESLRESLDESPWEWLIAHLKRDAVILVSRELDLLEVAEKVALDDQAQIATWIQIGWLSKPSVEQMGEWDKNRQKKFLTVIVQPYVLAQEHLTH